MDADFTSPEIRSSSVKKLVKKRIFSSKPPVTRLKEADTASNM